MKKGTHASDRSVQPDMNGRPCFVPMPLEIVIAFDFDIVVEMN